MEPPESYYIYSEIYIQYLMAIHPVTEIFQQVLDRPTDSIVILEVTLLVRLRRFFVGLLNGLQRSKPLQPIWPLQYVPEV